MGGYSKTYMCDNASGRARSSATGGGLAGANQLRLDRYRDEGIGVDYYSPEYN